VPLMEPATGDSLGLPSDAAPRRQHLARHGHGTALRGFLHEHLLWREFCGRNHGGRVSHTSPGACPVSGAGSRHPPVFLAGVNPLRVAADRAATP